MSRNDRQFVAETIHKDGSTSIIMGNRAFDTLVQRLEAAVASGKIAPADQVRVHRLPEKWLLLDDGFPLADLSFKDGKAEVRFAQGRSLEDTK